MRQGFYVVSLVAGLASPAFAEIADAGRGAEVFAEACAVCHGTGSETARNNATIIRKCLIQGPPYATRPQTKACPL